MNILAKIKQIKPRYLIIAGVLLVLVLFIVNKNGNNNGNDNDSPRAKTVKTEVIDQETYNQASIKTVGSVNPDTKVNISALTRGTVRSVLFEIGDKVNAGDLLVLLSNDTTLTNVNNAQTNLVNTEGNLLATQRVIEENIRQAELGVENAEKAVMAAEIGLNTAQTNLKNTKALKNKTNKDSLTNAVTSYNSYLNSIFEVIDSSNNILDIEDEQRLNGIAGVLGVKDLSTINQANQSYFQTESAYNNLRSKTINTDNVTREMNDVVNALETTKAHIDDMVNILENSVSNSVFNETSLTTQKNIYYSYRSGFIGTITAAKTLKQSLENIDLLYNSDIDALNNAVKAAENNLTSAQVGLENALAALENTKKGTDQQLLNSESAVDNARGQLNLARSQAGDLYIKAPINGRITQKSVELGAELSPGQMVAEISQDNLLRIDISLPGENIYQISPGQDVKLGSGLKGIIQTIAPAADPVTKKVGVEISFDNANKELIQGTFVDVEIPVENFDLNSADSLLIPIKAVVISQNESYVFGIEEISNENNETELTARKINIETGKTQGALIEITSGVEAGTEIIIDGARNLKDGDLIKK